jgi:type I restriction enzyme S subunit
MAEWQTVRLSKIVSTNQSTYSPKEDWQFANYLDTGNITMNQIDEIQYINTSADKLPSRARRKVKLNSIIYSTVRPNQLHYGIIKKQPENFLVSTGFVVIDVDFEKAVPDYIYYVLTQKEVTEHLQAIAEQSVSAYPSIKPSDIENLELFLPDRITQEKIVAILNSIDKKIKQNNEINNNLEQQVLTIYRHNFVDTSNELRQICRADEYFDISIGKTPPRKEPQWFSTNSEDITWVSISDMGTCGLYISNSSEKLTKQAINRHNVKVVPDNTVLLSFKLTVGRVAITDGEVTTNEAIAHFKTDKKEINEYLYCYLKYFNYQTMGSTSSIATAVNSKIIKGMPFIVPTDTELKEFHNFTAPIFAKIKSNQLERDNLTALRDALLPKLMSGELDISNIEL